jgi:AsmA protein
MRKWIALGIVVLVFSGGLLLAVLNLNAWLNENREWVGRQAEAALGRRVSFGEVGVSLWPGLAVRLADLQVGDDPAFSQGDFVRAESVAVGVKLLPALLGSIEVSRVILRSPDITVIQTKQGRNTDSLGGAKPAEPGEPAQAAGPTELIVGLIDIRDGRLRLVDRTGKEPVELLVERIDLEASDVSPRQPIEFELGAAVLGSDRRNVAVSGTVGPIDTENPAASRLDLALALDPLVIDQALKLPMVASALPSDLAASGTLRVDAVAEGTLEQATFQGTIDAREAALRLGESFDKARGVPLELSFEARLEGENLTISSADLVLGKTKVHSQAQVVNLADPKVDFTATSDTLDLAALAPAGAGQRMLRDVSVKGTLALPEAGPDLKAAVRSPAGLVGGVAYQNLALDLALRNQRATIETLVLQAFEGQLSASGTYDMRNPDRPVFDLRSTLTNMRAEKLVESQLVSASQFVQGNLGADLSAKGAGAGWEAIQRNLTGTGSVVLDEGMLKDVNLADSALEAITGVPGLSALLSPNLRSRYPQVFGVEDTVFEKLDAQIDIRDGFVHARDLRLAARDYAIDGHGRVSLEGRLDMTTVMSFSESLSQDLVASVKQARYLRGRSGRVELPVRLTGALPKVVATPDLGYVAQAVSRELVGSLLEKALGGATQPTPDPTEPAPEGQPAPAPPPVDPTEELIRRGLGELFGN